MVDSDQTSSSQSTVEKTDSTPNLGISFGIISSECDELLDDNIIIDEITEIEPTSLVLNYCKRNFLRPYIGILGLIGLRPMNIDSGCRSVLAHMQTCIILTLLITGYVLQFLTGFRRDQGFEDPKKLSLSSTINNLTMKSFVNTGEVVFIYIIPAILHLSGYVFGIYVYRIVDNELLQSLIERIFILSSVPRKLVLTFLSYFLCGAIWLSLSITYLITLCCQHFSESRTDWFDSLTPEKQTFFKILFYITLFTHDLIQVILITSYCLQCYLLRSYLLALKEKLLLHTIEPLDWMREICEFRKLLHHLNTKISLPVAYLCVLNLSYTFSSIVHLFRDINSCPIKLFSLSIANIALWMFISIMPFIQAAKLTLTCRSTQSCGHLVSIRPFVHRNTSSEDLNTVLLYASTLQMSAKLFKMPINCQYLCFIILCVFISILTFGMCIDITLGGS